MEQLLLNIKLPIQKTFENFIVGNNKECFDVLQDFILPDNDIFFKYIWGGEWFWKVTPSRSSSK